MHSHKHISLNMIFALMMEINDDASLISGLINLRRYRSKGCR